jgi:hypothetical protein
LLPPYLAISVQSPTMQSYASDLHRARLVLAGHDCIASVHVDE